MVSQAGGPATQQQPTLAQPTPTVAAGGITVRHPLSAATAAAAANQQQAPVGVRMASPAATPGNGTTVPPGGSILQAHLTVQTASPQVIQQQVLTISTLA